MPKSPARSSAKSSGRQARLARALRANLKRRKAQARAKAAAESGPGGEAANAPAPHPRPNMAQKAD
jgi:hypothetical protein